MEWEWNQQFLITMILFMGVQNKIGKKFFPNITIESVNVFDVLGLCSE